MTQHPRAEVEGDAGALPVADLSYTQASRELDEIVAFFEQREVDVDLLVARLERATSIVDELDRRLRRTRAQVEQLVPRLEAATAPDRTDVLDDEEDDVPEDDPDEVGLSSRRRPGSGSGAEGANSPGGPPGLF